MDAKCQCGAVHIRTSTPAPSAVYHCHCTQCRKQSSSAFGTSAIFPSAGILPLSPELDAALGRWSRPTARGGTLDCYFCRRCGVRVMHAARKGDGSTPPPVVSVKGGIVEGLDFTSATHIHTLTAVVPIPEGAVAYPESPPPSPPPSEKKGETSEDGGKE